MRSEIYCLLICIFLFYIVNHFLSSCAFNILKCKFLLKKKSYLCKPGDAPSSLILLSYLKSCLPGQQWEDESAPVLRVSCGRPQSLPSLSEGVQVEAGTGPGSQAGRTWLGKLRSSEGALGVDCPFSYGQPKAVPDAGLVNIRCQP